MEFVRLLLIFLHFVGLASLLGGWLAQLSSPQRRITSAILHGAATQLLTGVALVGLYESVSSLDQDVNVSKITLKLAVVLVILVLSYLNRAKETLSNGIFFAVGGLALLNTAVAVFWT